MTRPRPVRCGKSRRWSEPPASGRSPYQNRGAIAMTFLLTPEQHRTQAAPLRKSGDLEALELARHADNLAKIIEARNENPVLS
jgi:hypothetical protein